MPAWATFAAITGVVLVLLLALSSLTNQALQAPAADADAPDKAVSTPTAEPELEHRTTVAVEGIPESPTDDRHDTDSTGAASPPFEAGELSTAALLANVAISQGLFAGVLVAAAFYTEIPLWALGVRLELEYLLWGLVLGTAIGGGLYVLNEVGAAAIKRVGIDHSESLRELLAPTSRGGWVVLLGVVLPMIAFFEELLFRAALIGVLSAAFELSPWLLAVGSSIVFALGHGIQGPAGIIVTGTLGFVLAAVFILTGSLLVVVVAHYLINALEFIVHEGLELEWTAWLGIEGAE